MMGWIMAVGAFAFIGLAVFVDKKGRRGLGSLLGMGAFVLIAVGWFFFSD